MDDHDEDTPPATDGTEIAPGTKLERWRPPGPGEIADPIDEIISGWKSGSTLDDDVDSAEEDNLSRRTGNRLSVDSEESASDEDDSRVSVVTTTYVQRR